MVSFKLLITFGLGGRHRDGVQRHTTLHIPSPVFLTLLTSFLLKIKKHCSCWFVWCFKKNKIKLTIDDIMLPV